MNNMKTIEQINSDMSVLANEIASEEKTKEKPRTKKKRELYTIYNKAKIYIESNPSEQYIVSEIERLNNKIKTIDTAYASYCDANKNYDNVNEAFKKMLYEENDVKKIKQNLSFLNYLLK